MIETGTMSNDTPRPTPRGEAASVGEVVEFVKTYAKQETVGPLRGAGKWIAYGAAGAICLGIGLSLLLLGLLRLLQSETGLDTSRYWSWVPYLIVLAVCGLLIALAALQINKTYLDKDDQR